MSTSHPCALTDAFNTIHEEVRKLQRENNELRMKNNQAAAQLDLAKEERDDMMRQVKQLRGALARRFGVEPEGGKDITGIVQVIA